MFLRRLIRGAVAALLCPLLLAAGAADAQDVAREHARPLRLGIVNSYGQELTDLYYHRSIETIRRAIAPRALEVRVYGPDTFLDAAIGDQVDMTIASYGLTSIMLRRTGGTRVLTAVSKRLSDPYAANGAVIIARSDRDDINTFEDLPGKSLAVMSITAFAGWQVPMAELTMHGMDVKTEFGPMLLTGEPMTQILDKVRDREVDVGFVANCLLEDAADLGRYNLTDFKVIGNRQEMGEGCAYSTGLFPNWSFAVRPTLTPQEAKTVVKALLALPDSGGASMSWTLTPDATGADSVFQRLNLPYAQGYGLRDLLLEYSGPAFGALAVVFVLLANVFVLTVVVRIRTQQMEKAMAAKMRSDLQACQSALKLKTMEKLSAVGTLSSMAAHELKQPLTVINNYAGSLRRRLMRSDVPREVLIEAMTEIEQSGLRAAQVIDLVRGYAANKQRRFVRTDLADNVRHVVERHRKYADRITVDLSQGSYVRADVIELELVITNLLKNALAAVADVENPSVRLTVRHDEGHAWVSIADNGKPLTDEQFAQIGQIGRTSKSNGMGMGLAIVQSLLEAHSGSLKIERIDPCGIRCTARLPLETQAQDDEPAAPDGREPPTTTVARSTDG